MDHTVGKETLLGYDSYNGGTQNDMNIRINVARKNTLSGVFSLTLALAVVSCSNAVPSNLPAANTPATEELAVMVPDGGWTLGIERILELDSEVWILARVRREPGPAAQTIQPAKTVIPVALPAKPRRIFVTGKTWAWPNQEPYEFVPSLDPVLKRAGEARVLYPVPVR
jgi:hypothetical protein